jgi:hippurate hydrolase
VGRENNPLDPAVVTVGSIHGGTKHNVIPDEVKLQLTVRSYKDEVRKHLLEAIARIAKAEAEAAMAPKPPEVKVTDGTPATYNDPALTKRIAGALQRGLGAANVSEGLPVMAGEDFSEYGRAGVPATVVWVGAVDPKKFDAAKAGGPPLPSLHSSEFAPDREPTIRTGVKTVTLAAMELLARP